MTGCLPVRAGGLEAYRSDAVREIGRLIIIIHCNVQYILIHFLICIIFWGSNVSSSVFPHPHRHFNTRVNKLREVTGFSSVATYKQSQQ